MIDTRLSHWLELHAEALHAGHADVSWELLKQLGDAHIFRHGVASSHGGLGNSIKQAIEAIAHVAEYSLTAAFVAWSQRTYIQYILHAELQQRQPRFAQLLAGEYAGATGLSNAIKYLSGCESLNIQAEAEGDAWRLNGVLPWVTNFHPQGFSVAIAAQSEQGAKLFLVPSNRIGFQRQPNLDLIGLRGSSTAAAQLKDLYVTEADLLSHDAQHSLSQLRPEFVGLQCSLAIGLTRQCLKNIQHKKHAALLHPQLNHLQLQLQQHVQALYQGLAEQQFVAHPQRLYQIRIGLSELSQQAIQLELISSGGQCYLNRHNASGTGFLRRLTEAAFIPIVSPSVLQLQYELDSVQRKVS